MVFHFDGSRVTRILHVGTSPGVENPRHHSPRVIDVFGWACCIRKTIISSQLTAAVILYPAQSPSLYNEFCVPQRTRIYAYEKWRLRRAYIRW